LLIDETYLRHAQAEHNRAECEQIASGRLRINRNLNPLVKRLGTLVVVRTSENRDGDEKFQALCPFNEILAELPTVIQHEQLNSCTVQRIFFLGSVDITWKIVKRLVQFIESQFNATDLE